MRGRRIFRDVAAGGFLVAAFLLMGQSDPAEAAIPQTIAFQGKLADSQGTALEGSFTVTFRIYDAASGGAKLWEESKAVSVSAGLFSTQLGSSTALNLAFDKPYWVEIQVGSETLSPRQPLASGPYAFRAQQVEGIAVVNGNVGVGTASPQKRLDVQGGAARVSGRIGARGFDPDNVPSGLDGGVNTMDCIAHGGLYVVSGDPGSLRVYFQNSGNGWMAGRLAQASDVRLKTAVAPLTGVLSKLEKIRGVSYERVDGQEGSRRDRSVGVIAQEVEGAFPELVSEGPGGYKGVNYSGLTAALVEAVKELKGENEALRQRVKRLEAGPPKFLSSLADQGSRAPTDRRKSSAVGPSDSTAGGRPGGGQEAAGGRHSADLEGGRSK